MERQLNNSMHARYIVLNNPEFKCISVITYLTQDELTHCKN